MISRHPEIYNEYGLDDEFPGDDEHKYSHDGDFLGDE